MKRFRKAEVEPWVAKNVESSKNVEISVYYATLNQFLEAAIQDMDLIRGALESWGLGLSNAHRMVIVSILLDRLIF